MQSDMNYGFEIINPGVIKLGFFEKTIKVTLSDDIITKLKSYKKSEEFLKLLIKYANLYNQAEALHDDVIAGSIIIKAGTYSDWMIEISKLLLLDENYKKIFDIISEEEMNRKLKQMKETVETIIDNANPVIV